jgi:hypothetical protein
LEKVSQFPIFSEPYFRFGSLRPVPTGVQAAAGVHVIILQDAAAELGEGALAAGKGNDLLITCLPVPPLLGAMII